VDAFGWWGSAAGAAAQWLLLMKECSMWHAA